MEPLSVMDFDWVSHERDKYIWEDLYQHSWDEVIGRMYLLKAHCAVEESRYTDAIVDFEQALMLFTQEGVKRDYYYRALADKAVVQYLLGQYQAALSTLDQALVLTSEFYRDTMVSNRNTILALVNALPNLGV